MLHDLCPEHTCCTELGNLHEVVATDAHVELNLLGCEVNGNASLHHFIEVFLTPGEGVAQFLIDVGAAVVEQVAVHHHATQVGEVLQLLHELRHVGQEHRGILTLHQHSLNGVEADAADNLLAVVALLVVVSDKDVGQFEHVALAGAEAHLDDVAANAVKQRLDELGAHLVTGNAETEGVDAFVEDVQRLGVGFLGICDNDVLANVPLIVVLLVAAHEGELARKGVDGGQLVHVFLQIERLHGETFVGSPNHFLLVVSALEIDLNLVAPFLAGGGGEVREEFFFTICHSRV